MTNAWGPDEETRVISGHNLAVLMMVGSNRNRPNRWDLKLTFIIFLPWNRQVFILDRTSTMSFAAPPCSEDAIHTVLGAGSPRLALLVSNINHNQTGHRFPGGLHTTLIQFHYLKKRPRIFRRL